MITTNPLKCGSCDGLQVQHKNTRPQQNQQEVSRANGDRQLIPANFIIAQTEREKRKPARTIRIISKVTTLSFPFRPTFVLLRLLFSYEHQNNISLYFTLLFLLNLCYPPEHYSLEARVLLRVHQRPPAICSSVLLQYILAL